MHKELPVEHWSISAVPLAFFSHGFQITAERQGEGEAGKGKRGGDTRNKEPLAEHWLKLWRATTRALLSREQTAVYSTVT